MVRLRTIISEFFVDLRAQKLRAFLTTFGIIWGTVAIVVLVAFGVGMRKQTVANMHGMGESISILFAGKTTKAYQGFGTGREFNLTEDEVTLIRERVPEVGQISAEYVARRTPARVGDKIITPGITGVYPIYGDMRNIIPDMGGRFINDNDVRERRRVVVLGNKVAEMLFPNGGSVGSTVFLGRTPFTVIGVMVKKTQPSSYNTRDQDRVFIPSSTFSAVFGTIYLNNIVYKAVDPMLTKEVEKKVRGVLAQRFVFDPEDEDAMWIWSTAEFDKFAGNLFLAINAFLGLIGSFTLGVAGVGVANIMFIVVQERIKEIGVKRAVGARRSNIMMQFFLETFMLIAFGSVVGFLIAIGIVKLLGFLPIKEYVGTPEISGMVVAITVIVLTIVGLASGLMPARKAARMNVVDCLRA